MNQKRCRALFSLPPSLSPLSLSFVLRFSATLFLPLSPFLRAGYDRSTTTAPRTRNSVKSIDSRSRLINSVRAEHRQPLPLSHRRLMSSPSLYAGLFSPSPLPPYLSSSFCSSPSSVLSRERNLGDTTKVRRAGE